MNIKITHNWLLEYLDTKATPEQIQKYLSLCGPSIESVTKIKDDYVYDIEITSNRIDTASVIGIAREACAILNRFGIHSKMKNVNIPKPTKVNESIPLMITDDEKLCLRVISIVMDNVKIKESPQYIKDRLEAVGIRSLNNIIDITNYVMVEYGHPTHVMDYDRIKTGKLIIRKAKKGESLVTFDGKKYNLDEQDVIADDGIGRIVDLLGIMGCENSVVTSDTKRVVLFIESNNPQVVRHTSMKLGIRTIAATYEEKNVDSELTLTSLHRLIQLYNELSGAKTASKLIDIYHEPKKPKSVLIKVSDIERLIGVKIPKKETIEILGNLGFKLKSDEKEILNFEIPSNRSHDIRIKEDLIEEIARIYGYFNLPNKMQPMTYVKRDKNMENIFIFQNKIKLFLKHLGLNEVLNYSMISEKMITDLGLKPDSHLKLANTMSEDIKYLRISLIPSLMKNIRDNQARKENLRFFELAKTYIKRENDLPEENFKLGIIVNSSLGDLKGIVEGMFKELNIISIKYKVCSIEYLNSKIQAEVIIKNKLIGYLGLIMKNFQLNYGIEKDVFIAELDFQSLIDNVQSFPTYRPITPYAVIKLDLTFEQNPELSYAQIKKKAFESSKLLTDMEFISIYKNKLSLRFYFSSPLRNITEEEAKNELKKIQI